jgi:hypothetical protein
MYLPWIGPWIAELRQVDETPISGAVTLTLGDTVYQGTVDPTASGTHLERVSARIVGGAGGWGTVLPPKGYHNDAGIKASLIADDAATAAGESLDLSDGFAPLTERLGVDYVRTIGPAARAPEDAIGGVPWWVGADGITYVGVRDTVRASPDVYDILDYDPHRKLAQISVDDLSAISVGSILSKEPLEEELTVRDLTIRISEEGLSLEAWCGGAADQRSRSAQLLAEIARRSTDSVVAGLWRYRVIRMVGERVELQAVRQDAGVPDLILISMWPGVAGAHATLEAGAECLVQFIEGDRTRPVITHFAGKDGVGHVPAALALCGDDFKVARQGDLVQSGGLGATIMLTGAPSPIVAGTPYLVSFAMPPAVAAPQTPATPGPLFGSVITGSSKVKAGG